MTAEKITSLHDPSNCSWVTHFNIESQQLHWPAKSGYYLQASYELKVGHPAGSIQFGKSSSVNKASITWLDTTEIQENAAINHCFHQLTNEDLNYIWWVKFNMGGNDYFRYVYYSLADAYPGNSSSLENSSTLFPEKDLDQYKDRKNMGVCFSGGGTRALVMGMGQMRFLNQFKDKIGYFSSVSGGSWASSIYAYSNVGQNATLLGEVLEPSDYDKQLGAIKAPTMCVGAQKGWFPFWTIFNFVRSAPYFFKQFENELQMFPNLRDKIKAIADKLDELDLKSGIDLKLAPDRFWIDTIGLNFFMNNGMYDATLAKSQYFSLDKSSRDSILNAEGSFNKVVSPSLFHLVNKEEGYPPYLIMNSLMLRPGNAISFKHIGYEYTPLYQGAVANKKRIFPNQFIGGGNTAMHTYGANASSVVKEGKILVMRQSSQAAASLAVTSGTSSSAFAGFTSTIGTLNDLYSILKEAWDFTQQNNVQNLQSTQFAALFAENPQLQAGSSELIRLGQELMKPAFGFLKGIIGGVDALTPKANYFSPRVSNTVSKTMNWSFGDAGLSDNFGLMALLRRKVENIVIFINTGEKPNLTLIKQKNGSSYPTKIDNAVAAFFNRQPSKSELGKLIDGIQGMDLEGMQVFESTAFDALIEQWQRAIQNTAAPGETPNDKPMIAQTKLDVIANEAWSVPGGWKTNILWIYNSMPETWSNQLSDRVKPITEKEAFPYLGTFSSTLKGLEVDQINLLSNLSYWCAEQAQELIKKMLQ